MKLRMNVSHKQEQTSVPREESKSRWYQLDQHEKTDYNSIKEYDLDNKLTALLKLNFVDKSLFQDYLDEINKILNWYNTQCSSGYYYYQSNCQNNEEIHNETEATVRNKIDRNKTKIDEIITKMDNIANFEWMRRWQMYNVTLKEPDNAAPVPTTGGKKRKSLKKRRKSKRKSLKNKRKTQKK